MSILQRTRLFFFFFRCLVFWLCSPLRLGKCKFIEVSDKTPLRYPFLSTSCVGLTRRTVILCFHYHSLLLAMKVYVVLCPPFSQNLHKRDELITVLNMKLPNWMARSNAWLYIFLTDYRERCVMLFYNERGTKFSCVYRCCASFQGCWTKLGSSRTTGTYV